MKLRCMAALLGAALALPVAAQTPAGATADGTPVTIAGVSAITVGRPGTVTTAVKLREKPSTSAAIVEYWSTTTQKEPELFVPVGATVRVVARTAEKEKVGDWNNYWYRVEITTAKQGAFQAWAYGEFIRVEAAGPQRMTAIAAGGGHSLAIGSDGTLWAWGNNGYGGLGDGTTTNRSSPVPVGLGSDWVSVVAGSGHSLALMRDGSLWAWGENSVWILGSVAPGGQLGDGTSVDRPTPVQIGKDRDWVSVSAVGSHSLAIKRDGSLWAWGRNDYGQLGDGSTTSRSRPVRVGKGADWASIAAGESHSLAIKRDGSLWAWGKNSPYATEGPNDGPGGQLGDGTIVDRPVPVRVGKDTDWASVEAGWRHSLATKKDGSLWAWGDNSSGQLGDATNVDSRAPARVGTAADWVAVAAGGFHSLALKRDGTLWAWGRNDSGELGDGTAASRTAPVRVGTGSDWGSVCAGGGYSLALKRDGTLWAWGRNDSGQLGDGGKTSRSTPVRVGRVGGVAATTIHAELVRLLAAHLSNGTLEGFPMPAQAAKRLLSEDEPVFVTDLVTGAPGEDRLMAFVYSVSGEQIVGKLAASTPALERPRIEQLYLTYKGDAGWPGYVDVDTATRSVESSDLHSPPEVKVTRLEVGEDGTITVVRRTLVNER